MAYSDNLARKVNIAIFCQSLSGSGELCRNLAEVEVSIHQDSQTVVESGWFAIFLCEDCAVKYGHYRKEKK